MERLIYAFIAVGLPVYYDTALIQKPPDPAYIPFVQATKRSRSWTFLILILYTCTRGTLQERVYKTKITAPADLVWSLHRVQVWTVRGLFGAWP